MLLLLLGRQPRFDLILPCCLYLVRRDLSPILSPQGPTPPPAYPEGTPQFLASWSQVIPRGGGVSFPSIKQPPALCCPRLSTFCPGHFHFVLDTFDCPFGQDGHVGPQSFKN